MVNLNLRQTVGVVMFGIGALLGLWSLWLFLIAFSTDGAAWPSTTIGTLAVVLLVLASILMLAGTPLMATPD
jgi:lipopolysaccharide export LptBFGC system permease protein LptF